MRRQINFPIQIVLIALLTFGISTSINAQKKSRTKKAAPVSSEYVVATEHGVPADGKTDCAPAIEKLIAENPNRTIFFPDGTYLLSRPVRTPAKPALSVHLLLANYAVVKAMDNWEAGRALIELGAIEKANDIITNGSNYGLYGGIIDGSDIANGISIDGGRETRVENVSIKHTQTGIHIKHGANSGSSDADINNVNIIGNNKPTSIGVLIEGYDNTLSNMRIYGVNIGVDIRSGGNSLRNIHPLYRIGKDQVYETSIGFIVGPGHNWLNFCYSDQLATGFKLTKDAKANLTDCYCYWYSGKVPFQTAIACDGQLKSIVTGFHTGFRKDCPKRTVLKAEKGGSGIFSNYIKPDIQLTDDDVSSDYAK